MKAEHLSLSFGASKLYDDCSFHFDAKDKAGVYVRSYSRSVNSFLTDDDILAITNSDVKEIGETQFEQEEIQASTLSITLYKARVKVNVDTDGVLKF